MARLVARRVCGVGLLWCRLVGQWIGPLLRLTSPEAPLAPTAPSLYAASPLMRELLKGSSQVEWGDTRTRTGRG